MREMLLAVMLLTIPLVGCADDIREASPGTLLSVTQSSYEDCQMDWIMLDAGQDLTLTVEKDGGFWAEAILSDVEADWEESIAVERSQDEGSTSFSVPNSSEYRLTACGEERTTATLEES